MCKYGPGYFVGYKLPHAKSQKDRDREMTGQTEVHISKNYHTTPRSNKTDQDNHCC